MRYYHNLYLNEELLDKKEEILYKLEHGKFQWNQYVLVLSQQKQNQLEFYNASMLLQRYFRKQNPMIVGLANGFEGALQLVEEITQEVYDDTKGADIRAWLEGKQREFEERKV